MDNYICINGKKTELTEEQLKQLGIEVPKESFFKKAKHGEAYYYINSYGVNVAFEIGADFNNEHFLNGNYCTNKSLMEQRVLHETLNRLLWRYSMEHDGDKIIWDTEFCFKVCYDHGDNEFIIKYNDAHETLGAVYFYTMEAAESAIEEVIKPFIVAHPEIKF